MKKLIGIVITLLLATFGFASGTEEDAAGDVVVLDTFVRQSPMVSSVDNNQFTDLIEEKFGVEMDFTAVPSQGADEKLSLLMASGDYPSILWTAGFDRSEQARYGGQGVIIPINDLIEQYGPNIQKRLAEYPEVLRDMTNPDGTIYGLPHVEGCYHCTYSQKMWINTDWLNNLGLEMPTTTDEFADVLEAFKTQDPNGNGEADEIPLTGSVQWWHAEMWPYIMNAFVPLSYDWSQAQFVAVEDGKVYFAPTTEAWREGLAYMNGLYEDGLIDQQGLTQQQDAMRGLVSNPDEIIVGAFTAGHVGMGVSLEDRERFLNDSGDGVRYRALPPIEGPGGAQYAGYFPPAFTSISLAMTIKATDEQQLKMMEIADWIWTTEGTLTTISGPEGVGWRWAESGELGLNGEPAVYATYQHDAEAVHNRTIEAFPFWHFDLFNSWAANQDITSPDAYERFLVLETEQYEPYRPEEPVPPSLYYNSDDAQTVAQIQTELQSFVDQFAVGVISGQRDLDSEWNDYLAAFDGLRLEEYLSLVQAAYDAQQ